MRALSGIFFLLFVVFFPGCKEDEVGLPDGNDTEEPPVEGRSIVPKDFLSDADFEELIVEVQYVEGYQPTARSLTNLKAFLEKRLHKPAGITIMQHAMSSPGKAAYTVEDVRAIEKAGRTEKNTDKTLTAYFFFADADYASNSGDSKVLGIAYGASSMVIFEKTVRDFSGGLAQPAVTTLETTVIHHEFAHILGLVNNGTAMQEAHQDIAHGRHCVQENCLMYYTAETTDIIGNIIGGNIPQLDASCIADLQGSGGK